MVARQIDRKGRTAEWQAAVSGLEDAKAKAVADLNAEKDAAIAANPEIAAFKAAVKSWKKPPNKPT